VELECVRPAPDSSGSGESRLVLALDVFERTVTAADGPPAEGRELARALEAEMDDDMWGLFLNLFRKVKAHPALKRTLRTRHDQLRRIAKISPGSSRPDPAVRAPVPDKPPAVGTQ